ncbi:hypothetical protein HY490_04955 [Candidatus Woesearchaeota archaeon]|nr:hypothetical protein [Candidatus Woesearchaeota archaeon]
MNFPEENIRAAKALAEKYLIEDGQPRARREIFGSLALDFQPFAVKYGVADAVMSGKRIRLMPDIISEDPHAIRHEHVAYKPMNCAEAGVNLLLVMSTLDATDSLRLMRYTTNLGSDHFAVVDLFNEQEPWIFDPFMHLDGRVKFSKNGFIYYPLNYVYSDSKKGLGPEDVPHHFKLSHDLLTIDDVVRHVNYINSPTGFLDYYATGQKIAEEDEQHASYEVNVQTIDGLLGIHVMCEDNLLPEYFSFHRIHSPDGTIRDYKLIHTDLCWVIPMDTLYAEGPECAKVMPLAPRKRNILLVERIRAQIRGTLTKSPEERSVYVDALAERVQTCTTAFSELRQVQGTPGVYISRLADIDMAGEKLHELSSNYACIQAFPPLIDHHLHCQQFKKRRIRPSKPYAKFARHENPLPALKAYTQLRYEQFKPIIDKWLDSPVVAKLAEQYKEAIMIMNMVQEQTRA